MTEEAERRQILEPKLEPEEEEYLKSDTVKRGIRRFGVNTIVESESSSESDSDSSSSSNVSYRRSRSREKKLSSWYSPETVERKQTFVESEGRFIDTSAAFVLMRTAFREDIGI